MSVYRLITSGTIEEVVYNRQVAKQQMANATLKNSRERRYFQGVMGPNGGWIEDGELGGIRNLFSLTKDEVTTKEIEAREHARAKLTILKIPPDIMEGMKQDADSTGSDNDEYKLLKELAQLMERGENAHDGAVDRQDLVAEGAVHVHLNTSTDSSRRQMVGNSALDEFELQHLSSGDNDDAQSSVFTAATAAFAAAAAPRPADDDRGGGSGGGGAGGGCGAGAAAAAAAVAPLQRAGAGNPRGTLAGGGGAVPVASAKSSVAPLEQALTVVAQRRGLTVSELKRQIASDTIDGGKQVVITEIQQVEFSVRSANAVSLTAKQKKSKTKRQQSLPESLGAASAKRRKPWSQLTPSERASAVLDEVARRDGFENQQLLREFIAECKSAEGIAEYGQEECDRCLARIALVTQEVQKEMNAT